LGLVPLLIYKRKEDKAVKEENTLIFAVDDRTRITNAGKNVPWAGLKKGSCVSIKYKKHGDRMVAVRRKVLAKSGREG